jgi:hypothetical protein
MTLDEINKLKEDKKGKDTYDQPDFYQIDDLLTEEHIMVRDSM